MRHHLWLLSAFSMAATLALGITDAEAKKSFKASASHIAVAKKPTTEAYAFNTSHCVFMPSAVSRSWDWKNAHLTAQFIKTQNGAYRADIMQGATNQDERLPLASIAKLMTALVALDLMDQKNMNRQQMIAVTPDSLCLNDNHFAVVGLPAGIKEISLGDALTHTLKLSSNTMATNVAIATAGSVPAFVKLMNEKAREWGMRNTHFISPNGLPEGDRKSEYTTANDMLIMARHILPQFERFKTYSHAPLKPWILPQKADPASGKYQLSALGAVFKTGTIMNCSSLLTIAEVGDNKIVDIQLCGKSQTRFQNALAAVKNGMERLAGIVSTEAVAAPVSLTPDRISLRQDLPSVP